MNLRVVAVREGPLPRFAAAARTGRRAMGSRSIVAGRQRVTASVWPLDDLASGATIAGPAILAGRDATALVAPGWHGTVHPSGAVLVERA